MTKILIISSEKDAHSRVVAWSLRTAGHEVVFWDTTQASQFEGYSVKLTEFDEMIRVGGTAKFDSAWLRRVFRNETFPVSTDPSDQDFVRYQHRKYLDGVLDRLGGGSLQWLNNRHHSLFAESKIEQLHACKELGIPFPETVITNDPTIIRKFIRPAKDYVIKPLDVHTWEFPDGSQLMSYTAGLDYASLEQFSDESLLMAPAIYQERIHSSHELRVVYVAGKTFAVKIENTSGTIDYRQHQTDGTLVFTPIELDPEIHDAMCKLCSHFNLVMASSDFCVDKTGAFKFLDLNPGGAFLFVEYWGGGGIVREVARFLSGDKQHDFPGLLEYNSAAEIQDQVSAA